jgi:hypothetical protein
MGDRLKDKVALEARDELVTLPSVTPEWVEMRLAALPGRQERLLCCLARGEAPEHLHKARCESYPALSRGSGMVEVVSSATASVFPPPLGYG